MLCQHTVLIVLYSRPSHRRFWVFQVDRIFASNDEPQSGAVFGCNLDSGEHYYFRIGLSLSYIFGQV